MNDSVADHELLIRRTFDAPVPLVFSMWADPDHFRQWMGPANFSCPVIEMDFRVGGSYRAMIYSDEHGENWFGGVYKEIETNKRLVFTFTWDSGGPSDGLETMVTILFREIDGKTEQIFHQTPLLSAERRDSHVGGWTETFGKQEQYLNALTQN